MPETASKSVEDLWRQIVLQKSYLKTNREGPSLVVLHYNDYYDLKVSSAAGYVRTVDGKKEIMGLTVYLSSDVEVGKPVVA